MTSTSVKPVVFLNNKSYQNRAISKETAEYVLSVFTNSENFLQNLAEDTDAVYTGPGPREYNEYGKLHRGSVADVVDWCIHLYLKSGCSPDDHRTPAIPETFEDVPIMIFYR